MIRDRKKQKQILHTKISFDTDFSHHIGLAIDCYFSNRSSMTGIEAPLAIASLALSLPAIIDHCIKYGRKL